MALVEIIITPPQKWLHYQPLYVIMCLSPHIPRAKWKLFHLWATLFRPWAALSRLRAASTYGLWRPSGGIMHPLGGIM